jgi:hypothetical protein
MTTADVAAYAIALATTGRGAHRVCGVDVRQQKRKALQWAAAIDLQVVHVPSIAGPTRTPPPDHRSQGDQTELPVIFLTELPVFFLGLCRLLFLGLCRPLLRGQRRGHLWSHGRGHRLIVEILWNGIQRRWLPVRAIVESLGQGDESGARAGIGRALCQSKTLRRGASELVPPVRHVYAHEVCTLTLCTLTNSVYAHELMCTLADSYATEGIKPLSAIGSMRFEENHAPGGPGLVRYLRVSGHRIARR